VHAAEHGAADQPDFRAFDVAKRHLRRHTQQPRAAVQHPHTLVAEPRGRIEVRYFGHRPPGEPRARPDTCVPVIERLLERLQSGADR
jgi:hypothetical protein